MLDARAWASLFFLPNFWRCCSDLFPKSSPHATTPLTRQPWVAEHARTTTPRSQNQSANLKQQTQAKLKRSHLQKVAMKPFISKQALKALYNQSLYVSNYKILTTVQCSLNFPRCTLFSPASFRSFIFPSFSACLRPCFIRFQMYQNMYVRRDSTQSVVDWIT